jgi:hypothetical protein
MVKINPINPNSLALQTFELVDFEVIPNTVIDSNFSPVNDRIEYFIYDFNNNLLNSNNQLTSFTPARLDGEGNIIEISLNPEKDAIAAGFDSGIIKTIYNFTTPQLGSDPNSQFFISEISPSRTEVRLSSNNIDNFLLQDDLPEFESAAEIESFKSEISLFFTEFQNKLSSENRYFDEFYLNLGDNLLLLGINVLLEVDLDTRSISLLVKLYEPLPTNIGLKSELYIVTKTGESVGYQIDYPSNIVIEDTSIKISGPNYNIPIKDQTGPLTEYKTYSDITATTLSGSLAELMSNVSASSLTLNIDYTDYEDFVFFSSATERLVNFKQKLTQISSSQAELNLLYSSISGPSAASAVVSSSKNLIEQQIQTTLTSFDGYESYLYYDSGSKSWPKSNSVIPYVLVPPTNAVAVAWYDDQYITASLYDNQNQNNLEFVVPEFIRSNSSNENYMLFTNMIGQFFDEIWLYTKEITSKLDANSSLYEGVSKDLAGTVLESLGTKIYDSSFTLENIYSSLIGLSSTGATSPSTGSEYITNYVTSSIDTDQVPTVDDFVKLSYKKIYHNLPYLLKKKGTNAGLRALINLFGVPDTILNISEFGGKDKNENNDWDRWEHEFNYKFDVTLTGSQYIETPWLLNPTWGASSDTPESVQLRFKTPSLQSGIDNVSQSLWSLGDTFTSLVLEYTGSGYTSGSYSGSIPDVENQYATLKLIPDSNTDPTVSASVYLPFYDGEWWSVMVTKNGRDFTLYAADSIYKGNDGSSIGFIESSSATVGGTGDSWEAATTSNFGTDGGNDLIIGSNTYTNFTGSYQEIRYFSTEMNDGVFRDYTMNPNSIEGNTLNSGPNELAFRAPLGGQLYTSSVSMHPKITGSWEVTQSFRVGNSNFTTNGTFSTNRDYIFYDQIPAGVKNIVSNKVKQLSNDLPYTGSLSNTPTNKVLSSQVTVQQKVEPSSSYVDDINYLEVAFSPQNEINENINSSIGYFNIGEFIGDPRLVSSSAESYPGLDRLRNDYFEKYTHSYDIWDYIRLIRYYDNALFKMIKDYVPARTSLATGIVFKQHILERNKYPVPQLNTSTTTSFQHLNDPFSFQNIEVSGSPIQMYTITGSNGGVMPDLNGQISASGAGFNISPITQSWSGINDTIQGPVSYTSSTQDEFFNGEFSGSEVIVTDGEMNPECDSFKTISTVETLYSQSWLVSNAESAWNQVIYYNTGLGDIIFWFKNTYGNISTVLGPGVWDFQIVAISINAETANLINLTPNIPAATNLTIPGTFDVSDFTLSGWSPGFAGVLTKTLIGGPNLNFQIKSVQERTNVSDDKFYLVTIEPSELKLRVTNPGFFGSTGSIVVDSGSLWDESLVVLEPFIPQNFYNSDCNPIINNTLNDRLDPFFLDVDYSSNAITAVNTQAILSGSGTPAAVQASNYTLARQIRPRYLGSRNEGLYINKWSPSGSLYSDGSNADVVWGGDSSYGKTAVIDQYGDYALYYRGSGVGDFLNGGPNNIFLNISFMFDQQGNIFQPKIDTPYYWNGISAFGGGNNLQLTVYNSSSVTDGTLSILQQPQTSYRAFEYHNTYLTTIKTDQNIAIAPASQYAATSMYLIQKPFGSLPSSLSPQPVGPFFSTGSLSKSVLTGSGLDSLGSLGLGARLGQAWRFRQNQEEGTSYVSSTAKNIEQPENSGFDYRGGYDNPISNIAPRIGDTVYLQSYNTFGNVNTLNSEFTVVDITESGNLTSGIATYKFFIHLDRDINDASIHNFTFIDKVPDTSKLYTNIPLSGSAVGNGFIFNENTSDSFKNALDANISDFDVKRLI